MKTKWLERGLLYAPCMALCLSDEEFQAAKKHLKPLADDDPFVRESYGAEVHTYRNEQELVCLVCVNPDKHGEGDAAIAGILAHEAVHVWQAVLSNIREDAPGDEISAHAIQHLVLRLMDDYLSRETCSLPAR